MRKLLLALLLLASPASAQQVSQLMGNSFALGTGSTSFLGVAVNSYPGWAPVETDQQQIISSSGTISALRVCLDSATGTGSRAFTLRVNNASTALTTTITNGICNADILHTVSVSPGDRLALQQATTGTLNSNKAMWSLSFTATTPNEQPMIKNPASVIAAGLTRYSDLQGSTAAPVNEADSQMVIPTAGVFKNLYINIPANTVAGTVVVMVRKAIADTTITATIPVGANTATDLTHTLSVVPDDIVSYKIINNDTAATRITLGMTFYPTVPNESIYMYTGNAGLNAGTSWFATLQGGVYNTIEANSNKTSAAGTVTKLHGRTAANINSGSVTHAFRINGVNSALTCTILPATKLCTATGSISVPVDAIVSSSVVVGATGSQVAPFGSYVMTMPTAAEAGGENAGGLTTLGVGS